MLEGLIAFRREFQGNYWLEVFLLAGVSTTDKEMERLKSAIDRINSGQDSNQHRYSPSGGTVCRGGSRIGVVKTRLQIVGKRGSYR